MIALDELALKYRTDKSSDGHWYTCHYERIFGPIRLGVESVLEVGIGDGASLRMWRDYFPEAIIYGIDIRPIEGLGDRIVIYECDQTDCQKLHSRFQDQKLEIVIEDASHEQHDTMKTLECLWSLIEPKGWYAIEDMEMGSFPSLIAKWLEEQSQEIRDFRILKNRTNGSAIVFIQKR